MKKIDFYFLFIKNYFTIIKHQHNKNQKELPHFLNYDETGIFFY